MFTSNYKVLYIHGFATNITHLFKIKQFTKKELFPALFRIFAENEVYTFRWGLDLHLNIKNIWEIYNLYQKEKKLAKDNNLLFQLHCVIDTFKPKIIICHSIGCYLFINYIKKFNLSKNIAKIVFIQADLPKKQKLSIKITKPLKNKKLEFINFYCYWDDSLTISSIINKKLRAGSFGL